MERAAKYDREGSVAPQSPKRGLPPLTPELLGIKARLMPLIEVENNLVRRLMGGAVDTSTARHGTAEQDNGPDHSLKQGLKEVAINSAIPWKNAFNRLINNETRDSFDSAEGVDWDDPDDPWPLLNELAQDMSRLWNSPNIKQLLVKQKIKNDDLNG